MNTFQDSASFPPAESERDRFPQACQGEHSSLTSSQFNMREIARCNSVFSSHGCPPTQGIACFCRVSCCWPSWTPGSQSMSSQGFSSPQLQAGAVKGISDTCYCVQSYSVLGLWAWVSHWKGKSAIYPQFHQDELPWIFSQMLLGLLSFQWFVFTWLFFINIGLPSFYL